MKSAILHIITLLILLCFFSPLALAAESTEVIIVYSSNMPNIETQKGRGGFAELATLLAQQRAEHDNVLFLHGGGSLGPSLLSSFDRGAHFIDILNSLDPGAMAIAKREFSFKEDELIQRTYEAAFPMLNANAYDPASDSLLEGVEPTQLFEFGAYSVGVLAVVDPEVMVDYSPNRIKILNTEKVIRTRALELREQGADFVILMTGDTIMDNKILLQQGVVDCILLRDSAQEGVLPVPSGVFVEGMGAGNVAVISLEFTGKGENFSWRSKAGIIPLSDFSPHPELNAQIDSYVKRLNQIMDTPIGVTQTAFDTIRTHVRTKENAFGNLIADALRETMKTDVALMNGGGIRGDRSYFAGDRITRRDVNTELPFRNMVSVIRISGKQLKAVLENGFSRIKDAKGRFPHISGIIVRYNPKAKPGKRLVSLQYKSKDVHDTDTFTLATADFIAKGGDGYTMLSDSEHLNEMGGNLLIWEIVQSYISNKKTISPAVDGRLTVVTP